MKIYTINPTNRNKYARKPFSCINLATGQEHFFIKRDCKGKMKGGIG